MFSSVSVCVCVFVCLWSQCFAVEIAAVTTRPREEAHVVLGEVAPPCSRVPNSLQCFFFLLWFDSMLRIH